MPAPRSRLTSQGHHTQYYHLHLLLVIQLTHNCAFLAPSVFSLLHVRLIANFVDFFYFLDICEFGNIVLTELNSSAFDGS